MDCQITNEREWLKLEQFKITNHAMERYAKRIAKREEILDVNAYITMNEEKITEDINKMLEYSDHIYTGKVGTKDKNPVNVYLSGTWVILSDITDKVVITVYKIDFNLGEDFNKQFINGILDRMAKNKEALAEVKKRVDEERDSYQNIIDGNNAQINEFKSAIKELEKLNADYQEVINDINSKYRVAEMAIKRDVEDLVMRREF